MFETQERSGLARIGSWELEGQKKVVKTPNILFVATENINPPPVADIIVSDAKLEYEKALIKGTGSLFGTDSSIDDYSVSPHLEYPLSLGELNASAAAMNRERLKSRIFVVVGAGRELHDNLTDVRAEIFVLANALHLFRKPRDFVDTMVALRKAVGYQGLIYAPGLGSPSQIALLAYLGIDLFDSLQSVLNARMKKYLTTQGGISEEEMYEDFCFCPACSKENKGFDTILAHNYYTQLAELKLVRGSIKRGPLRELVESRAMGDPHMVSILRILDSCHYDFQERHLPVMGSTMHAGSHESLYRPEIVRFRERVQERYAKPPHKKVLLLLPCSAKKPYGLSKSHRAFSRVVRECKNPGVVHEVIITSPLAVVPREVELFYPAQQYDIPVTRTWSLDEIDMITNCLQRFLEKNRYESIIVHLPEDYMFVGECLNDFTRTCRDSPTSMTSLAKLQDVLTEAVKTHETIGGQTDRREALACFAQFQFGEAGTSLLDGALVKGRYPNLKIFQKGTQAAMLVGDRGLISLTLHGGRLLAERETYWVRISDFEPKGNIFAVGVDEADEQIRIGDDVVVLRKDKLVGVGVVMMSPEEMVMSTRGEAVRIRHLAKTL